MADQPPIGTPEIRYISPVTSPHERLHPALRPIFYLFLVPIPALMCGLSFEVRLGEGYGKIYPGTIATTLVLSLLMVRYADRRPIRSFGLALDRWAVRDIGIGLLISAIQLGLIFEIERRMCWIRVVSSAWNPHFFRLAVLRWVAVALSEELLVRGYFFQSLDRLGGRRFGAVLALGITSAYFGYAHGDNPHAGPAAILFLMISGLEYGVAYLVTRRLWLPISMHFAWNMIEGTVLGFPVSGAPRPSFLELEQGGPPAWTGGQFGPEAGYLSPALSLIDIGVLLWLARLGFWKPEAGPLEAETLADQALIGQAVETD